MDEMTIVSIEKTKRGLYVVNFEEDFITVPKDLIVRFGLFKGLIVDSKTISELKEMISFYEVYHKALQLLGLRGHFTGQLKIKLLQRDYSSSVVEEVILQLTQEGYLNDETLLHSWVEAQSPFMSHMAMQQKLTAYGLDAHLVRQVLKHSEADESQVARALLEKKVRFNSQEINKETREKLLQYLIRKGFTFNCAKKVVDEL
jgi:regulatory protein